MIDAKYKDQILTEECGECLLCEKGACAAACPYGVKTDEVIRSIRFENVLGAAAKLPKNLPCIDCMEKPCKTACLKSKISKAVDIDKVMRLCAQTKIPEKSEVDLSIDFLNIHCENPFFLSSSVVGSSYEMIAKAFDMGWSGVVFKSITSFPHEEVSPRFATLKKEANPFIGFKNLEQASEKPLEENLNILKCLKKDYPNKAVISSIMGQSEEDWKYLAKVSEEAGVDALELNFSCPHMAVGGMGSDVGENPEVVAEYVRAVRSATKLPLIAKMTPNTGNMVPPASAAVKAGADSIAAINTIKSIMNIRPETFVSEPAVCGKSSVGGYSGKAVKPIACRFIYDMATSKQIRVPLTGMGGIETWKDAMDFIALGCSNIQVTTSIMQYGYRIIDDMIDGMKRFLASNGFKSVTEIVGAALPNIIPTDELERKSICLPKFQLDKCVGCGRCYISCYDGGHQAIIKSYGNKPRLDAQKCVGCHLCVSVCPAGAITSGPRVEIK